MKPRTDREKLGLIGAVESVLVEAAQLEEQAGQLTEKPTVRRGMIFNHDGWLTQQSNTNPDGSEWRIGYDYSDSGNLLAMKSYDSSGALAGEVRYVYDSEGRLVAEQSVTPDGKASTPITYTYDTEGRQTKTQELDTAQENVLLGIDETIMVATGEATRIETSHDDRGEAVEVKCFNTAGSLVNRIEITRDAQGKPLEETQHVGDIAPFRVCGEESCSTEEMQSLTEEQKAEFEAAVAQMFSAGAVMSRHTHQYDAEGRLIESTLTMMGMVASRRTFSYDETGNRAEEVSYNPDGTFASKAIYTRDYDEHLNWTKELVSTASTWDAEFGLSTPAQVTRRTITYYA
jgi:RHS Repeat